MRATVSALVLALLAAGCGDSGTDTTVADTSAAEEPAAAAAGTFEVTFRGDRCEVDGPLQIEPGDRSFVVTNTVSTEVIPLYVVALADGHTMQDLFDLQRLEGGPGAFMAMPDWVVYALRSFGVPEPELTDSQQHYGFSLDAGVHAIYLRRDSPSGLWLCAPLDVVVS